VSELAMQSVGGVGRGLLGASPRFLVRSVLPAGCNASPQACMTAYEDLKVEW
jgi:hypothetical protein